MRLPSSSQCAATFLLGCTRGGSPGILGVPTTGALSHWAGKAAG